MWVRLVLIAFVLACPVAVAAPTLAHTNGCLLAVHALDSDAHVQCNGGNPPCLVELKDGEGIKVYGGCGMASGGNCPVEFKHESIKLDVCTPKL